MRLVVLNFSCHLLLFLIPWALVEDPSRGRGSRRAWAGWIASIVVVFAYLGVTQVNVFSRFARPSDVSLNIYWLGGCNRGLLDSLAKIH